LYVHTIVQLELLLEFAVITAPAAAAIATITAVVELAMAQ
jgi:hypothetical protein